MPGDRGTGADVGPAKGALRRSAPPPTTCRYGRQQLRMVCCTLTCNCWGSCRISETAGREVCSAARSTPLPAALTVVPGPLPPPTHRQVRVCIASSLQPQRSNYCVNHAVRFQPRACCCCCCETENSTSQLSGGVRWSIILCDCID